MANTDWLYGSNPYISFSGLWKIASIDENNSSFTTEDMTVNGGSAELAINIDDALIEYGTINYVIVKYTCYGSRTASAWKKAWARTGYTQSEENPYVWEVTHEEAVGRGSSNKTPFEDRFTPQRALYDNKYHLVIGARNPIAGLTNKVYFSNVSIYIDYEPPHTHSYTSTVTKQPTCTSAGETTFTCSCGHSYKDTTIPAAKGHTWVAANCTTPKKCSVCGATEGSALGHNYVGAVTKQPTCTEKGVKTYTCQNDTSHKYTEEIPAKGHTEVKIPAVAATCTETGLTEGKKCSVCNTILVAQQTVPALGHSPSCYPEITSIQMLYSNKQISADNKVPAGEYFRIVVGAVAHH